MKAWKVNLQLIDEIQPIEYFVDLNIVFSIELAVHHGAVRLNSSLSNS